MEQSVHILSLRRHLCILIDATFVYIMYVLNVPLRINEIILASSLLFKLRVSLEILMSILVVFYCRLSNAKYGFYIYIYKLNVYDLQMKSLKVTFLKQARAHLFAHS